jgi:hypothetical protein
MTYYNIPFDIVESTHLNAQYLCHYMSWKPATSLGADVLVATASFFMVFWACLGSILTYFARKGSRSGMFFVRE